MSASCALDELASCLASALCFCCRCLLEIQQAGDMSAIVPPGTQSPFLSAGNKRVSLAGRKFNSLASIAVTTECKFTIRICMAVFLPLFRSYEAVSVSGQVVKLQQAPGLAITFANPQSPGVRGLFLAVAFCQNGLISGGNCMGGGVSTCWVRCWYMGLGRAGPARRGVMFREGHRVTAGLPGYNNVDGGGQFFCVVY